NSGPVLAYSPVIATGERPMRRAVLAVLILAFVLLLIPASHAQQPPAPAPTPAGAAASTSSAPVPVPAPSEKALRYYRSGNALWVIATLWALVVPALLLFTGSSARR